MFTNSCTQATDQMKKVYIAFFESPKTMKEVDVETNVMRESICRYVRTLRLEKRIEILRKRKCTITGNCYVNEYTTNPDLFPRSNQLKLF